MGMHSHGVMRIPEYLERVRAFGSPESPLGGPIDPRAEPSITREVAARATIDGNGGFGQVAGMAAVEVALRLVERFEVSLVSVRHAGHVGRLGAYPDAIAKGGCAGLAFCSAPIWGHWVAPFGGRDGRMATNPMAYAFPTQAEPVVADFATSATTEGAIRYSRNQGRQLPVGVLIDVDGHPTTDASSFYTDRRGAIMPMGGELNGHKGSATGLLVELMGSLVAGDDVTDRGRIGNNMTLIAIRADSGFIARADVLVRYVRSSRPVDPARPVQMPGDRELDAKRTARTVTVDERTWAQIAEDAARLGIDVAIPGSTAS
jgi:uncharacterized oxidoreductase